MTMDPGGAVDRVLSRLREQISTITLEKIISARGQQLLTEASILRLGQEVRGRTLRY